MEKAYGHHIITHPVTQRFVGINLGCAYCVEHEVGIRPLQDGFAINTMAIGLKSRKANLQPDYVFLDQIDYPMPPPLNRLWLLMVDTRPRRGEPKYEDISRWGYCDPDEVFATAWDRSSFAILHTDEKPLRALYLAIMRRDVAVGIFANRLFKSRGLGIYIASRIPQEVLEAWVNEDISSTSLEEAAAATGIREKIQEHNNHHKVKRLYYSLRPEWVNAKNMKATDYNVVFWLNPKDDSLFYTGFFTVEELELWLQGEGPVFKRKV